MCGMPLGLEANKYPLARTVSAGVSIAKAGSGWKSLPAAILRTKRHNIGARRFGCRGELNKFISVAVVQHVSILFHAAQCRCDGLALQMDATPLRDLNGAGRIEAGCP